MSSKELFSASLHGVTVEQDTLPAGSCTMFYSISHVEAYHSVPVSTSALLQGGNYSSKTPDRADNTHQQHIWLDRTVPDTYKLSKWASSYMRFTEFSMK